ncbi:hypothetical protein [Hymenobacter cellulosilyticus]|uniref:Uncharacterized protein n=1 Tax=Hymenobacter cellulosilyticus TaxID=2932248 RepID=A0A8T9PYY5_9BACT|nr:hypothetical protein [Hymenobacter cellulosilyticus]UOQ70307.1 hypothetical protein MUN79_16300 [Hymenobacter cellulosilyticus]
MEQDANGKLQDGGVLLLPARDVIGVLGNEAAASDVSLYFFDRSVSLEHFYARVRHADLEKLIQARLEFVPAK